MKIKIIIASFFISLFSIPFAQAEDCKTWDLNQVFYEEYDPNVTWVEKGKVKNITWTTNSLSIHDELVTRKFTQQEEEWAKLAFKSWDDALDSVFFTKVEDLSADISIGWVKLNEPNAAGYWNSWKIGNLRVKATIKLKDSLEYLKQKDEFIHIVQHELGNVLGLGDINNEMGKTIKSSQQESWIKPYGTLPLNDNDISMIRQKYGESTCPSSWKTFGQLSAEESLKNAKIQTYIYQEDMKSYMNDAIEAKLEADRLKSSLILALGRISKYEIEYESYNQDLARLNTEISDLRLSQNKIKLENNSLKNKISAICKKSPKIKECRKK